ncbi:hypothetical protein [Halobacterium zhouii]|uniref:hypothetical protein n=1 Tax=Halobacterium zhouii TaxID=2902624 RepID=UPI001E2B11AB|nr:hypothetical protein [Halobacterium zhouii]
MPSLQVVSIDGTVIECDNIEPQKQGLMLKEKVKDKKQTIGFIPWWTLMYVIPEDVVHNLDEIENPEQLGGQASGAPTSGGPIGGEETQH